MIGQFGPIWGHYFGRVQSSDDYFLIREEREEFGQIIIRYQTQCEEQFFISAKTDIKTLQEADVESNRCCNVWSGRMIDLISISSILYFIFLFYTSCIWFVLPYLNRKYYHTQFFNKLESIPKTKLKSLLPLPRSLTRSSMDRTGPGRADVGDPEYLPEYLQVWWPVPGSCSHLSHKH